jgi:hypothetical protein
MTVEGASEYSISFLTPCLYLLHLKLDKTASRRPCFTKFRFVSICSSV